MKIAIINGPNLNLLGSREKDIYGNESFVQFFEKLQKEFFDHELHYFQSNIEGELITEIQQCAKFDGIIINAGGYTHTSVAIADAIAAINTPAIEVHISNIFARENFRHVSYLGAKCKGSISGFGLESYRLALKAFGC